jgi:hypothetical protein
MEEGGGANAEAEELVRNALKASPLFVPAIRALGLVEERKGNVPRAAELMEIAASRSLYEAPSRLWLVSYYAQEREVDRLVVHLNALLNASPYLPVEVRTRLMDGLVSLALAPETSALVVSELKKNPNWRGPLLRRLAEEAPNARIAAEVFAQLQRGATAPTDGELTPLLQRLIRESRFDEAYLSWVTSLDLTVGAEIANVYNGGFEQVPANVPFDWNFPRTNLAEVAIAPRAESDNALRVRLHGGRARFRHATETLYLSPGEYELSGEFRAEAQGAPPQMEWVLECVGGETVGRAGPFARSLGWSTFTSLFTIPENCPGQNLRLQHIADADFSASGELWFDNIQAIRVGSAR